MQLNFGRVRASPVNFREPKRSEWKTIRRVVGDIQFIHQYFVFHFGASELAAG